MTTGIGEQLVTSKKKLDNELTSNELTSLDIQLRALTIADGLTNTVEPNDMTAWYCKAYKLIGESRYSMVAKSARSGNNPRNLFSWLLKQEMNKRMA